VGVPGPSLLGTGDFPYDPFKTSNKGLQLRLGAFPLYCQKPEASSIC